MRWLSFIIFFSVFLPVFSMPCLADTNSASETPPLSSSGVRGHRGKQRANSDDSTHTGIIRGSCTLVESFGNPFATPCVNTLLVLTDADGVEIFKDRTDPKGSFEFDAPAGKTYHVVPESKSYQLVSPTKVLQSGDQIDLKIQIKN
jgi:hypothetical protein